MKHNNPEFILPVESKEFIDIQHRLEYYGGTWKELHEENKKVLVLDLEVPL